MTPEELSYQQGFLYPLYLILIGGLITGGLIPYFNRLHGQKLKEIERKREEAQKRIDREREDYRFELEIKERLIEKLSDESAWCFKKLKELVRASVKDRQFIQSDALDEEVLREGQITNLIDLYFKNKMLHSERIKLYGMIISGFTLACLPANSKFRRERIEEFQKKFDITLTKEEVSDAVKEERGLFDPLFKISSQSVKLYHLVLTSDVIIPHSKPSDKKNEK